MPVVVAAVLGAIMFYARLRGVYVAILMFVITLLCGTFMNQTAGPQWAIGIAKLGGNNGLGRSSGDILDPPSLTFGFGDHVFVMPGSSVSFYYLAFLVLLVTYLGLRWLVNSNFGQVLVATRDDPDRTELFGYNVRLLQLVVFCISALIAGLSGVLYVAWGKFITPDVFSVTNNILPVIWVAAAGRKSLTATLVGSLFLIWLSQWLAVQGNYAFIALGLLLIVTMMLTPEGLITTIADRFSRRKAQCRTGLARDRTGRRAEIPLMQPQPPSTPDLLLEVRDLAVSFGGVKAADGISLLMQSGELRCIIGPNGAGKSTLFKMLAGTVFPDRGSIRFNGKDITRTEPFLRARQGIGIKLQNVSAYSDLTVRHNLFLPLHRRIRRPRRTRRSRAAVARAHKPERHGRPAGRRVIAWTEAVAGDRHDAGARADFDAARRTGCRDGTAGDAGDGEHHPGRECRRRDHTGGRA